MKIALALGIAALVPLLVGIVVLETYGFRQLLATKGRLHEAEARALSRSLENAVESQAGHFWSWVAADPAVMDFLAMPRLDSLASREDVAAIEKRWPALSLDDPLMQEILRNPAAESLRRFTHGHSQAAEILLTNNEGRVVAATRKTSDYDQSDEDWWIAGTSLPEGGMWTDMLHFDASAEVFSLDLVAPIYLEGAQVGVVKMVLDVSPMFLDLRSPPEGEEGHFEILLSDGRILARTGADGYESLGASLDEESLLAIRVGRCGWTLTGKGTDSEQMAGFAAIQSPEVDRKKFEPGGYVLYSSPKDVVVAPLRRQVMMIGAVAVLATGTCLLAGFTVVDRKILEPIKVLSHAARALADTVRLRRDPGITDSEADSRLRAAEEDLERIEAIQTGDEVEDLAADFGIMTSRVMRYHRELEAEVDAKTAVIREDLEMAREFQNALMPSGSPEFHQGNPRDPLRLGFAHYYQPASTVGGDFFDLIDIDEHRTGVMIADVMGHGARSALITAILRALVSNHVSLAGDPGKFLGVLNHELHEVIERSGQTVFVTAFLMVIDTRESQLSWAVAGHPAPLRARRGTGNPPRHLWTGARRQPALGLMPDSEYLTSTSPVHSGDVFLLYTDGVVEAENPGGKEFGIERLIRTFDEALDGPLAAMPAKVVCEVESHGRRRQQDDDICVVAVEVSPGMPTDAEKMARALTGSIPSDA